MTTRAENDDHRARIFGRVANLDESRVQQDVADFRRVGLKHADAERAAMALQRGTYTSFRESALARATAIRGCIPESSSASSPSVSRLRSAKAEASPRQ